MQSRALHPSQVNIRQVPGLKSLLNKQFGYSAAPRSPLMAYGNVNGLSENKHISDVLKLEESS